MDIDPRLRSDTGSSGTTYQNPHHASNSSTPGQHHSNPKLQVPPAQQYPPIPDGTHHYQSQAPHTPQSGGHGSFSGQNSGYAGNGSPEDGQEGASGDPKRPRACEACRGLKVRCEIDPHNPEGACKRCAKANRNCVVTVPSRKRQKKTDSRVAELEKKIDALTATLQATKSGSIPGEHDRTMNSRSLDTPMLNNRPSSYEQVTNGEYGVQFDSRPDPRPIPTQWAANPADSRSAQPPMVIAGLKRKHQESRDSPQSSTDASAIRPRQPGPNGQPFVFEQHVAGPPNSTGASEYTDVIDRGVITAELATSFFNRYVDRMAPHMPAVVFPPGTTAGEIRKSKPTLFLAILGAGAGTDYPDLQRILTKEIMQVYADRIICSGEKTLELIQALLVSTIWYWPPEHFEEVKFYQLVHLAAVMAIDINISKKSKAHKPRQVVAGLWRDHQWRRTPFPDPETVEARRAWLACYFVCCNTSMGLRRTNLIRWSSYMGECIEVLETSPEAAASDKTLCQWVRSQHIAEEIGVQFSMDDAFATVMISDSKVQYALKGFERDLELWSDQVPKELQTPLMKMTEHLINLYMHEVALHVDHNIEEFKPPFTEETLRGGAALKRESATPLTPTHIAALSTCLTSIDGIFTSFLCLEIDVIRSLPVMHFVRIAYAVVVLIKMYFAAAIPGSELGKVIDKDNMKVEYYLDGLLEHFRSTAADDKSRPASKFLMVLIMLKTWFHRQRSHKRPSENGSQGPQPSGPETPAHQPEDFGQTPGPQHTHLNQPREYSPANTPLQLLSEVATGSNQAQTSRPDSRNQFNANQQDWNQTQQQSYGYQPPPPGFNMSGVPFGMPNLDPALGVGVDYDINIGDGFEQAIGMTLGDGEFGQYFGDDAFFGAMMGSLGTNLSSFDPS